MAHADNHTAAGSPADKAAALPAATPTPVLLMPTLALVRFRRLMQAEGWVVDLQRMCLDTDYAHRCLATGHTSGDARLRHVALDLFDTFGRNSVPPALH